MEKAIDIEITHTSECQVGDIVTISVNVGKMPPQRITNYLNDIKSNVFNDFVSAMRIKGVFVIFAPVREGGALPVTTKIETPEPTETVACHNSVDQLKAVAEKMEHMKKVWAEDEPVDGGLNAAILHAKLTDSGKKKLNEISFTDALKVVKENS